MDDIIKHLLETVGDTTMKPAIGGALNGLAAGYRKLSRKDKKAIENVAEKMVQVATLADIERYDQKFQTMLRTTTIVSRSPQKFGGLKKPAAKKMSGPAKPLAKKKIAATKATKTNSTVMKKDTPKRLRKIASR